MILAALPPSIYTFSSTGPITPVVQTMVTEAPSPPPAAAGASARAASDLFEPPPLVRSRMNRVAVQRVPRDVAGNPQPARHTRRRIVYMHYDVVAQGPVELD